MSILASAEKEVFDNLVTRIIPTAPPEIEAHAGDYHDRAWENYSIAELGNFTHLLAKRSQQRSNPEKQAKDLHDARNYWLMIGSHLAALEAAVNR
jgi:hypothetical protein